MLTYVLWLLAEPGWRAYCHIHDRTHWWFTHRGCCAATRTAIQDAARQVVADSPPIATTTTPAPDDQEIADRIARALAHNEQFWTDLRAAHQADNGGDHA